MDPICQILTPVGMLGYGFNTEEFTTSLSSLTLSHPGVPTAVILDSGSTDSGPTKLASGSMSCPRSAYVRDLRKLLMAIKRFEGVRVLVGSCGGDGVDAHVDVMEEIVREIAEESSYKLDVLKIYADIPKSLVTAKLDNGLISGCGVAVPNLTQKDIDEASVITSQMGVEPFHAAMEQYPDFDILLAGRTYDPEPYFAWATACVKKVMPGYAEKSEEREKMEGSILHFGKLMECGGQCATPKSAGAVAKLYPDASFEIVPTDPAAKCTPTSVAAHTLYEKSRPDILSGPGGWLDLTESKYEQLDDGRTVRAWGGKYLKSVENGKPYQVKLEGARNVAYRSMYVGSIRDPILIKEIDFLLPRAKAYARYQNPSVEDGPWDIDFHVYGRGTSEIVLVAETMAPTQQLATDLANSARIATIHGPYSGQKATAGNLAFGIAGTTEVPLGLISEFCVYHLMDLEPGEETSLYRIEHCEVDSTKPKANGSASAEAVVQPQPNGHHAASPSQTTPQPALPSYKLPTVSSAVNPSTALTLGDAAQILRSKNAGPYEITLDILFDRASIYNIIKDSNFLTPALIAELYGLEEEQVIWCGFFDQALGFKATVPRMRRGVPTPSGGFMEDDVHGSQKYVGLMNVALPEGVREKLAALGA